MDARDAQAAIEALRAEADAARQHAQSLELGMDDLAAQFQAIVDDLQGKLATCRAELEYTKQEADLSRQWLVHLSTEIMTHLGDAPTKLDKLANDMRANLVKIESEPRP